MSRMLNRKLSILSFVVLILITLPSFAFAWSGKVVGIADGDTITVLREGEQQVKIRFYGIDSPERGQAFSRKAKQFTSKMIFGNVVEVDPVDVDRYGRTVGIVRIEGIILNEELVRESFAWVYPEYCHRPICGKWYALSVQAHDAKKGLWREPKPIPPWEFRRQKRK